MRRAAAGLLAAALCLASARARDLAPAGGGDLAPTGGGGLAGGEDRDRPLLIPTRDVDVVYRMAAPGGVGPTQRLRWRVAERRLRVDPPGEGVFMIVDYVARRMQMVEIGPRAVIDMPTPPGLGDAAPSGARFERLGEDTVAATSCTRWRTTDMRGSATTVCLTQDGVLLRAASEGAVMIEATRVRYEPQDRVLFQVPDGYRHVAAPDGAAPAPGSRER